MVYIIWPDDSYKALDVADLDRDRVIFRAGHGIYPAELELVDSKDEQMYDELLKEHGVKVIQKQRTWE